MPVGVQVSKAHHGRPFLLSARRAGQFLHVRIQSAGKSIHAGGIEDGLNAHGSKGVQLQGKPCACCARNLRTPGVSHGEIPESKQPLDACGPRANRYLLSQGGIPLHPHAQARKDPREPPRPKVFRRYAEQLGVVARCFLQEVPQPSNTEKAVGVRVEEVDRVGSFGNQLSHGLHGVEGIRAP